MNLTLEQALDLATDVLDTVGAVLKVVGLRAPGDALQAVNQAYDAWRKVQTGDATAAHAREQIEKLREALAEQDEKFDKLAAEKFDTSDEPDDEPTIPDKKPVH